MDYLVLRSICLIAALFTMQSYFFHGAYTKAHRLLPVLLTCICLYCFYELVLALTNADDLFLLLEQLLLVQVIYIGLHYIFDFSNVKIPLRVEAIGFISLLFGNVSTILQHNYDKPLFHLLYLIFVYGFLAIIILFTAVFTLTQRIKSKRERYIVGMLYLAFLFPSFSIPFRRYHEDGVPIFSINLLISCVIIIYLLRNGYLIDMKQELQEKIFHNNYICTILFDSNKQFLDANHQARKCFSDLYMQNCIFLDNQESIIQYKDNYYRCFSQPVILDSGFQGYIVTALDVTEDQIRLQQFKEEPMDTQNNSFSEKNGVFIPNEGENAVLRIYQQELLHLSQELKGMIKSDLSLFRTTVHGIKSSSKQLGYHELGEQAEILEMAALSKNVAFIFSHIDSFLTACKETAASITERL